MSIRTAVIMVLTFVFGIVPATYLVFWALIFGFGTIVFLIVPPVETGGSSVVPWKVVLLLMAAAPPWSDTPLCCVRPVERRRFVWRSV